MNDEQAQLRAYQQRSKASNTKAAYQSALAMFQREGYDLPASPSTVAHYLEHACVWQRASGDRNEAKQFIRTTQPISIATATTHAAALSYYHTQHGYPDPCDTALVRSALSALKRERRQQPQQARALQLHELTLLLNAVNQHATHPAIAARDKALLWMGFAAGLRRAELCAIEVDALEFNTSGLLLTIPRSKTDPYAQGAQVPVTLGRSATFCPVTALQHWLNLSAISDGSVFRRLRRGGKVTTAALQPASVNTILRTYATAAGLSDVEQLSAHSLRAGCVTCLHEAGVNLTDIALHVRHQSVSTTQGYIRRVEMMEKAATKRLY